MEFGEYLRTLRKAKGMTMVDLAIGSEVSQSYLSQLENGSKSPSAQVIRAISNTLGVTYIGMMIKAGHLTEEEVLTYRKQNGVPN